MIYYLYILNYIIQNQSPFTTNIHINKMKCIYNYVHTELRNTRTAFLFSTLIFFLVLKHYAGLVIKAT